MGLTVILPWLVACTAPIQPSVGGVGEKSETEVEWQPGDDIPGWEGYEFECPLEAGSDTAVAHYPETWYNVLGVYRVDGVVSFLLGLAITSCRDSPCEGSAWYPSDSPYIYIDALDGAANDLLQKTGFYGPGTARSSSSLVSVGYLPVGDFNTEGEDDLVNVQFCVSRARPDTLRGVLYVTYTTAGVTQLLRYDHYPTATVQYPFEAIFPDHGSWEASSAAMAAPPPPVRFENHVIYYSGEVTYDNAWDWDAITDPTIRDAVYDRYMRMSTRDPKRTPDPGVTEAGGLTWWVTGRTLGVSAP